MQTINIEPNWSGMRRWIAHVFKTDPELARKLNSEMGCERAGLPSDCHAQLPYPRKSTFVLLRRIKANPGITFDVLSATYFGSVETLKNDLYALNVSGAISREQTDHSTIRYS